MPDRDAWNDWLERAGGRTPFAMQGDELVYADIGEVHLVSQTPDGAIIRLGPAKGEIILHTDGTAIGTVLVNSTHTIRCFGHGSIERLVYEEGGQGALFLDNQLVVREVDLFRAGPVEVRVQGGAEIEKLVVGGQNLDPRLERPIDAVHVAGGQLRLGEGRLLTGRLTTDEDVLTIWSGAVSVAQSSHQSFLLARTAALTLSEDTFPNVTVEMDGGSLTVASGTTTVENLRLLGNQGELAVHGGRVVQVAFEGKGTKVRLEPNSEVIEVSGEWISLDARGNATISAALNSGIALSIVDVGATTSVERVDFFKLDPSQVSSLEVARRVTGAWPSDRRERLRRGRKIDAGVRAPKLRPAARAHYWSAVERLLEAKNASGEDLVAAHQLAQDSRRLAAAPLSHERVLLEISRSTGYATRLVWPLIAWAVLACLSAVVIRGATSGLTLGSNWESGGLLAWDVFVSPLTWVRPLTEGSILTRLTTGHLAGTVIAFVARVIGTYTIGSTLLAARRYLRNP